MFGRATIWLGIGPHSSYYYCDCCLYLRYRCVSEHSGTSYALPWRASGPQKIRNYSADDHPRVVFISSKVPAAEVREY